MRIPPFGTITSVPVISAGRILNQSGISLDVARLRTLPAGVTEVHGYKERWRTDDSSVVRYFDVPWGQRKVFIDFMLGYSTNSPAPGTTTGRMLRTPPCQEPEFPWLYCTEINLVECLGAYAKNPNLFIVDSSGAVIPGPDGMPQALPEPGKICYWNTASGSDRTADGVARYEAVYRPLDYEVRTDIEVASMPGGKGELERYVTRDGTMAMSNLPLPLRSATDQRLKFAEGPSPGILGQEIAENALGMLVVMEELSYVWHDVPDLPTDAWDLCVGRINAAAFDGAKGAKSYPAETVYMQPPVKKRQRSPAGRVTWSVQYKFLYRSSGWNKFPAQDGNFYLATLGGTPTGTKVYKTADFDALFKLPPEVAYQ